MLTIDAPIDGVTNGVGDVFVEFVAIGHHAHGDDVDQTVGDSDRAAFIRRRANDSATCVPWSSYPPLASLLP